MKFLEPKNQKDEIDYEYINSVAQMLVHKVPKSTKVVLWFIFVLVFSFFVWAYFANIDQLVRGESKVVPSGQNQFIQNFEGGVITDILVQEGDRVKKGQILLKLKNEQYSSNYGKNILEIKSLKARKERLFAEANDKPYKSIHGEEANIREYNLYKSDINQLTSKLKVLDEQIAQKQKEQSEMGSKVKHLSENFNLILEEKNVMEPLMNKGIVSKVEFLKLLREANSIKEDLESSKISLKRIKDSVNEYKNRYDEAKSEFQNAARREYTKVVAQLEQLSEQNSGLEEQVKRRVVTSPVSGIIKQMYVNTIGGSVKSGMNLIEIVPTNKELLVEVKIKPKDIAFVYKGQKATVKISAYDYSIYGALDGIVEKISPDSITDKKGNIYYLAYVKSKTNYLKAKGKKYPIIPGMMGTADIVTGDKTVLEYILKPIIKTKDYALSEH